MFSVQSISPSAANLSVSYLRVQEHLEVQTDGFALTRNLRISHNLSNANYCFAEETPE